MTVVRVPRDAVMTPYGLMTPLVEVARVNLTGQSVAPPRLAPGAEWVSVIVEAFERAHYQPSHMSSVIIRINAIYPATGDRKSEQAVSDNDPRFPAWLKDRIGDSPWAGKVTQVHIREEWRHDSEFRIEVGIYGVRAINPGV